MAQNIQSSSVRLTSRWLNCCSERAVISGLSPRAVLLRNDSVYMIGSRSNNNENIWKYSISRNILTLIKYPPNVQTAAAVRHTIIPYQSQLLWIGIGDKIRDISSNNLILFALIDEETHSWKEVMPKSREILQHGMGPISISSASEDKYLLIGISEAQLLSVLIFDGQEWSRREGPDCTAPTHGLIDIIIHDGTIFMMTKLGFYKISLETILVKSDAQWKTLRKISNCGSYSNMTTFNDHIVVLTPRKLYTDNYINILAYESASDTWILLEELECHISWMIPSIMGLPDGRLLIFGVVPDQQQIPQFNILEATYTTKDDEEAHIRATLQAMEEQGVLNHSCIHGVFIGPARSGKNSLMERLLGKMPSSNSPSTGVAEAVVQVQVQKSCIMAASVEGLIWSRMDDDDEAIRLMILHSDQKNMQFEAQKVIISGQPYTSITSIATAEGNLSAESVPIVNKAPSSYVENLTVAIPMHTSTNTQGLPVSYVPPLEILKTAVESKGLQALQQHFEKTWSLYLSNTGGQMEFQEILPLLVSGPCMFFYTFRLDRDLNECYEIHYELPDGTTSDSYKSSMSTIEGIVQSLASIAAMGIFVYRGSQKRQVRLQPKVLFIGTHRDRLDEDQATDIIASIDQNLQKSARQFSDIVEFASEDQMMFAVNNFSQDSTAFREIRSAVERIVERHEFEMISPSRWLIYSLALRRLKAEIVSYEECFEVAKQCGIDNQKELNEALHFIHTKMGLIRYFPFEHIKDLVIIQPQFLYDKITELIVKTFTFEKVGKKSTDLFKEKGIFSLSDFERIHRKSNCAGIMKPSQFGELLKALHIAAPFEDGESKLFFPCVLGHASEAEEQIEISSLEISPLNITFKCGYCPKGLGGALINYLMTNGMNFTFEWTLLTNKIFRDQVSFEVGPLDTVVLRILPTHLMLIYIPEPEFTDRSTISCCVEDVCYDIQNAVDCGIRRIIKDLNFMASEVEPSFTFLCPCVECGNKHPAEIKFHLGKPICLCCKKTRKRHKLPQGYDKWFGAKPHIQDITTKEVVDIKKQTKLGEQHYNTLLKQLTKHASHWKDIGARLQFTSDELKNIEARPLLLVSAPTSWLSAMLDEWLQWTPGDSRGSRDFATLEALKSALSEAGLASAAGDLRLN